MKYAFEELNTIIERKIKFPNNRLLMIAITEHNLLVKLCKDLNNLYKYLIFILYYLCSPVDMLDIYYISSKGSSFIGILLGFVILIMSYIAVFGLTLFSCQIKTAAHKPRNYLYKRLSHKSLPLQQKLKLISFLEKLCGPDIGFYCYDLFPMNNYEFYLYITNCVKNYILFNDLFQSFN